MKEAELQEKLAELLRKNGSLADLINEESYDILIKNKKEEYGINEIVSQKYISSVEKVMGLIACDGKIIFDDGKKNISMNSQEGLHPDFVIYNEEDDAYVIIELKVSSNAERQAVTEVMAYQLEIRNYLPGLSNYNIPIVIISQDYRPLLKHAVASMLIENQNVLCLSVNEKALANNIEDKILDIVNCDIWTDLKLSISKKSFVGYTLCFYSNGKDSYSDFEMNNILSKVTELISIEAEKANSNGFAIAWKYTGAEGHSSKSMTTADYFVTYFCVDPYVNYVSFGGNADMDEHIANVIQEGLLRTDGFSKYTEKIISIYSRNFRILQENYTNFDDFIIPKSMNDRTLIKISSWGMIHDFIFDMLLSNTLLCNSSTVDIFEPYDFLKCISILTRDVLSFESNDDCFTYGKMDGLLKNISNDDYYFYTYKLTKEIWDNLTNKNSQMLCLYEYGKKFSNSSDDMITSKTRRMFYFCKKNYNKKTVELERKDLFEDCLFSSYVIEYIEKYICLDEEDDKYDEKFEQTICELYNGEKRQEVIQLSINALSNDALINDFIRQYKENLFRFYAYNDFDKLLNEK